MGFGTGDTLLNHPIYGDVRDLKDQRRSEQCIRGRHGLQKGYRDTRSRGNFLITGQRSIAK